MKSESEFINYHMNRIKKIQTSMNNKRIFVECFPTDDNAICLPNSNLAIKEIFFDADESSSAEEAIGVLDWLLEFESLEGGFPDKIIIGDGDYYWESDNDGDHPMDGKDIIKIYKQSKK